MSLSTPSPPFDGPEMQTRLQSLERGLISDINRRALRYWCQRAVHNQLPRKRDIDPTDMAPFLRNIVLINVCHDPVDFQYRLIGGAVRYHMRTNLTGRWMRDVPHNAPPSKLHSALDDVVQSRLPTSTQTPYVGPRSFFITLEDIVMPLRGDGDTIDHLLVVVDYFSVEGRRHDTGAQY